MQPRYLPLVQIFGAPARYTVPLFQRPYVWNKEEQWEPLWDDISHLADRVLAAGPGTAVAGHFLGTVVLEQTMTPAGTIGCREIIDGQQRLTTLQIVLKAAEHVLASVKATANAQVDEAGAKAADVAGRQVGILTANAAYSDDEEKYKVWPTNDDRAAFRLVMDAGGPETLASNPSHMAETYRYFHGAIMSWLGQGPHVGSRPTALAAALQSHIKLIVLDLDDSDEPQAIFETLNAHGTPLLPSDLIKNWLLWEASRQKLGHVEKLYQTWWRGFDADPQYWRAKIGTGHAARPRIDTFLQNWLTRRTGDLVPPKHLYARFLAHVSTPEMPVDIPALMEDIHRDGGCYRVIDQPAGHTRLDTFFRRLAMMDIVVFHPVLLALMRRPGSDDTDKAAVAEMLESYLVRRTVCGNQTRGYNDVMKTLLTALDALTPTAPAAQAIGAALVGHGNRAYGWPDDTAFRTAWESRAFYGNLRRVRVLMILQAIEEFYQREGDKGEPIVTFDFSSLEIEHILPQEWEANWPLPETDGAKLERERRLHGIGNLTLVSGKLNPSLSNAAWLDGPNGTKGKRDLFGHSKLQMNARLAKHWGEAWNHAAIDSRASVLFEAARKIWSPPPAQGVLS
jgi:hypothetical protein